MEKCGRWDQKGSRSIDHTELVTFSFSLWMGFTGMTWFVWHFERITLAAELRTDFRMTSLKREASQEAMILIQDRADGVGGKEGLDSKMFWIWSQWEDSWLDRGCEKMREIKYQRSCHLLSWETVDGEGLSGETGVEHVHFWDAYPIGQLIEVVE